MRKRNFEKKYQKSLIPHRLNWHLKDIVLDINEDIPKNYRIKNESYLKKAKEFYERALKSKTEKEEKYYLGKAKSFYKTANSLSSYPIQKERINNVLEEINNRLSIMGIPLRSLENQILPVLILSSFIFSLFLLSMNFTGAVIGTIKHDFSILGILFFIGGLIFSFVYARSKR